MKTLRQTLATMLLALALGIPTYAGDMSGPSSAPSPAPAPTTNTAASVTNTQTVPVDSDSSALTVMALDFLVSALSIY
jgi:hypothetical protein